MFTTPERDTPDYNTTVDRLKDVRFLFVDEISMVRDSHPHSPFAITHLFKPGQR